MKNLISFFCWCFFVSATLYSQPSTEDVNNMYGYEEVIVLELTATGEEWDIEVKKVCQGIPTKSVVSDRSIKMDFVDKRGKEMYSVSVGNPKLLQLHTENNAIPTERDVPCSIMVVVPYDEKCVKVVCSKEEEIQSENKWKKTFHIKEEVKEAYQAFAMGQ